MRCGLLGETLGHSYSPRIHSYLADYPYDLFEKKSDELSDFLIHGDYTGLNVTIPYKKAVLPYCTELSDRAMALGAVNTIVKRADGSIIGHNTDYFGFQFMLAKSGLDVSGKKVLILGSGGASVTVLAVLNALGANPVIISRSGSNNYENLYLHYDASVIVNATPVGMYPNVGSRPVSIEPFVKLEGVLDIVYNPARTQLLLDAEQRGLVAMNGLWMLVAQAKESAEWFLGHSLGDHLIDSIHSKLRSQMENTILIGMPGCGKSTIGPLVAQLSGKRFVDSDTLITERAGKTIPDIFNEEGEAGFRKWESAILAELGAQSGLVIATGGGCVTRDENYPVLHQNGRIIWLQRDISLLPTDGRPLSQATALQEMYAQRKPFYERFADQMVVNDQNPNDIAAQIVALEV